MRDDPHADEKIAECYAEYADAAADGASVDLHSFRGRLGADFATFLALIDLDRDLHAWTEVEQEPSLPEAIGPYTVLGRLGRGAMGVVYKARHPEHATTVALKLLPAAHAPGLRERFRREVAALERVRHPNIVRLIATGQVEGRLYYAMSYVAGRSLADAIRARSLPSHAELADRFADVADALQALHDAGILHRDIKPSNLILAQDGELVLADFGLARLNDEQTLTASGHALGTPRYSSPEQVTGRAALVDARSDVYSLGATLYEATTGEPLVRHDDVRGLVHKIVHERPRSPAASGRVPPALSQVILKCVEKRRADRYATAGELAGDLRAFAAGRRVSGRPVGPLRRGLREIRRRPGRSVAAVAGLILFAGLWIGGARSKAADTAWLEVRSVQGAVASLNGGPFVPLPMAREVPPGAVRLVLRLDGYRDREVPVFRARAGERYRHAYMAFAVADPEDVERLDAMAARMGWSHPLPVDPAEPLPRTRGGRDYSVLLLEPRGRVRIQDLTEYALELGDRFEGRGRVEFRSGQALLFASDPVETVEVRAPIPASVRRALASGDTLVWGFVPQRGDSLLLQCPIVSDTASDELAELASEVSEPGAEQPPEVATYFRAQALLARGLEQGALNEVREASGQARPSPLLLGLQGRLWQRLFEQGGYRSLLKSRFWAGLRSAQAHVLGGR